MMNLRTLSVALASAMAFAAATPALAAEPHWEMQVTDHVAFLHLADAAQGGIGFFCTPGFGTVGMFVEVPGFSAPDATSQQLAVSVGATRLVYETGALQGGLQAMLAADDPLFAAMAGADSLRLEADGKGFDVPLAGADFTGLQQACGAN